MSDWSNRLLDRIKQIGPQKILTQLGHGFTFANDEFGPISGDQLKNAARLIVKSQAAGLSPADIKNIFSIVDAESSFNTDPGNYQPGDAAGLGQFLDSTAKGYNTNADELRHNPDKAADLILQLYKDNLRAVGGDTTKAVAAYFIGADTVNKASAMPGDWIDNANTLAEKNHNQKPNSVSDYLQSTGQVNAGTYNRNKALAGQSTYPSTTTTRTTSTAAKAGPTTPPDYDNFWVDAGNYKVPAGTPGAIHDDKAYNDALKAFHENATAHMGDISTYIDNLTKSMANDIAAKRLTMDEASTEFTKRLNALTEGGNQLKDLAGSGDLPGARFRQGNEPGGLRTVLGMSPLPTSGITYNPMQTAINLASSVGDYRDIGTIDTGQTSALARANLPPGGLPATGTPPPPHIPPPGPDPASQQASNGFTGPQVAGFASGPPGQNASAFKAALAAAGVG